MTDKKQKSKSDPFAIKDCDLLALATGLSARSAAELRDCLAVAPADSLYYHFWGSRLRPKFDDPEYVNDFASWAGRNLHDRALAEKLSVVDPKLHEDLESLRREVREVIEERLDESERLDYLRADQDFAFIRSQTIIFDTRRRVKSPAQLAAAVKAMSPGSVFYHFIDARRRIPERIDDFSAWLAGFGAEYRPVLDRIAALDPYFSSLTDLREKLAAIFRAFAPQAAEKGRTGGRSK